MYDEDRINDPTKLSAEAQELIKLTTDRGAGTYLNDKIDVGELITKHPKLKKGLGEYLKWRDNHMRAVADSKESSPASHEMRHLADKLRKRKPKKKK